MSFEREGFLTHDIETVVQKHHKKFEEIFLLAREVNTFAHAQKPLIKIFEDDLQRSISFCLFVRILNSYASAFKLAEMGLCHDAEGICRMGVEALFYLRACSKDKTFAQEYVKSDQVDRKKFIKAAKSPDSELHELFLRDKEKISAIFDELEKEIDEQKIMERRALEVARKAGLTRMYDYMYRILSNSVHTSPRSIVRYARFNRDNNIEAVRVGPETETIPFIIFSIVPILLIALESIKDLFALDLTGFSELQKRYQSLDAHFFGKKKKSE